MIGIHYTWFNKSWSLEEEKKRKKYLLHNFESLKYSHDSSLPWLVGIVCVRGMGKLPITCFSIAKWLKKCGILSLICLSLLGWCLRGWWTYYPVGKVRWEGIGILRFGRLFLIVWCGVFGNRAEECASFRG